ncbi:hypothetical protein LOTGIDRAFT_157248 [Lottia gigantea]|uniref:Uncharacterized protein n=1 Tax=Lottia gigantea TaxID=225164 RepID=V4ADL0_LOTGI|nr:hypothetical protein LOTGIDRAFT_157248 [Lottia gigantea]ESP02099.1 hypothetical protein LOTGIDRAFT_157248 [Lottia gigantea]
MKPLNVVYCPAPANYTSFDGGLATEPAEPVDLSKNNVSPGPTTLNLHDPALSDGASNRNSPVQSPVKNDASADKIQRKRRRTEKDKQEHMIQKYPLLSPCQNSCRKSCYTKFSEEQQAINDTFWSFDFTQRRLWFDGHIIIQKDNCGLCARINAHVASSEEDHDEDNCGLCAESEGHKAKYTKARRQYQDDIESSSTDNSKRSLFAVDMQKVILLPKLTTKEHFFISRLVVFNETFASLDGDTDFVVLWHEGIAGRLATDVASAFIKCIKLQHKTEWFFGRQLFWSEQELDSFHCLCMVCKQIMGTHKCND